MNVPPESQRDSPYVSIVLPCYNEQDHVVAEVTRICAAMDTSGYTYELLAYDDASTDGTLARLYEAAPSFPHLQVVHFHRNGGAGTVRRIGTQQARGEIVVWTDADMTYPNERIPELVQMLEKDPTLDQVVGARTSEEGTHKFLRVPAKWFIRKLAERLTEFPDPGPELRAARVPPRGRAALPEAAAARILLRHDDHHRFPVQPARRPLRARSNTRSGRERRSSASSSDAYRYILQVLRMVMYFNPLKVLMPLALFLIVLGVAKGIYDMVVHPLLFADDTVLIFVSGLIIATLALLADLIVRSRSDG